MNRASTPRRKGRIIRPMGHLGTVKHADLQLERDALFDKYLRAIDQYQHWHDPDLYTGKPKANRPGMLRLLKQHIETITTRMLQLDTLINGPGESEKYDIRLDLDA